MHAPGPPRLALEEPRVAPAFPRLLPRRLEQRQIPAGTLESLVLGYTVPQKHFFYGAPWVAGMLGAPEKG